MIWNFEKYGENTALIDDTGAYLSYGDFIGVRSEIESALDGRCLVFLMCENSIGAVAGYASFIESGIVPVLLSIHLDSNLFNSLVTTYKPKFIWSRTDRAGEYVQYVVSTVYSKYGYSLFKTDFETEYPLNDDLCLLLTTSGSTGSPQFVRQSYNNVRANALAIVEYLELTSDERPITTLPMNYTYGLSIINSHFMVGAVILLTDRGLMQREFWSFFRTEEATSFGGVPYTYEMLDKLRFFRMELPSLRYMTQAGGKLIPELHRKFAEYAENKGKKFIVMYGQCEATARMGYLPADKSLEKCGSMGIAIPGGHFHLVDAEENTITEPDVTGELVYEGPNVTMGYAECGEDLIKGDERGGILRTGDMARFDSEGYYYIVGRKKRFLKIYGNRVNLDEIDRMIKARFDNIDVASAGKDDHMYIFLTDERLANEVREFVISKTKLNPAAFKTIVIAEIPKNDSGKTLYKELNKFYE